MEIPNMVFYPKSAQAALAILRKAAERFSKLTSSTTFGQLRDAVDTGYCPSWFVISDDPNLDYYVYYGIGDISDHHLSGYFNEYPIINGSDFLNDRVSSDGKVRHIHAELIEWFMASEDNKIEFRTQSGDWVAASSPNWFTETEYRKAPPEVNYHKRHQHDVLVEWANDQSLVLQCYIDDSWRDIKDGDIIDSSNLSLRIKPSELVELEKQALAIIANPALMKMINKLNN